MVKRYEKIGLSVLRHIGDYHFLIPVSKDVTLSGYVYVLNDSGARIWGLIDNIKEEDKVVKALLRDYGSDARQVEQDVVDFLAQLEVAGLVKSNG